MKKTFFSLTLLTAFCSLLFVGCDKENLLEGTNYNTIITVKGSSAKTSYNPANGSVSWTAGDKISVIRGNSSSTNAFADFTLIEVDSRGVASFGGNIPEDAPEADYVAVYPCQESLVNEGRHVTLTAIRTNQTLKQGSFGEGDNTSMGYNSSTTMEFRNVGGLAKIAVRGSVAVKSIRITSNVSGQKLSGRGTIDVQSDDLAITWDANNSYNYVEAQAADQTTGFDVSQGNTFYIVLPPCTLSNYTITIVDGENETHTQDYTTPIIISRATVTKLGAFDINPVDPNLPQFTMTGIPANEIWYRTTSGNVWGPSTGATLSGCTVVSNTYENGIGKIVLSSSLTNLGNSTLADNSDITELYFSTSLTEINGLYAIEQLYNLIRLELPGIQSIRESGLYWFNNLEQIVIPASLNTLNKGFIYFAKELKYIRFMKSDAIYSLPSDLESALDTYEVYVRTIEDEMELEMLLNLVEQKAPFRDCSIEKIYVPRNLLSAYQNNTLWSRYMDFLGAEFVGVE